MTFAQQVASHLDFLRAKGLAVDELVIDGGFVRCRAVAENGGRGECVYKTQRNAMARPGMVGLATWCRGPNGQTAKHKTYGLDGEPMEVTPHVKVVKPKPVAYNEEVTSRCRMLWDQAKEMGRSDYLERKGVGAYGIRFQETIEYGRSAVVPACDTNDILRALQFLNQDGQKRFVEGSAIAGLFHALQRPANGLILGIAESYATAASCHELSGIPVICAFCSSNLVAVAKQFRARYPDSRIIIFGDDDRHLTERKLENVGRRYAERAAESINNSISAFPNFGDVPPSKDASDWNDLARLRGRDEARAQTVKWL